MKNILAAFLVILFTVTFGAAESSYTVKKGDTLYGLAREFNIPHDSLMEINNISDPTKLTVGTELIIPKLYEAVKNDNYYRIAKNFDVSVESLLKANNRRAEDLLRVGEVLLIPPSDEEKKINTPEKHDKEVFKDNDNPVATDNILWPIPGKRETLEGNLKNMVTIKGTAKESVFSVSRGKVIYRGPYGRFGNIVFIESYNDYIYTYAGFQSINVKIAEEVKAGTILGELGSDPHDKIPKLYFGIWDERKSSFIDLKTAPRV